MLGVRRFSPVLLASALVGCTTQQGRFVHLGEAYPPRGENCAVDVFRGRPERAVVRIARLDVHLEATLFVQPGFDEALPQLRRQACLSGADAVVDIEERRSRLVETRIYHVTAFGVRYVNP